MIVFLKLSKTQKGVTVSGALTGSTELYTREMENAGKITGKGGRWKAEVFDALKKPSEPVMRWWDGKEMCWKEKVLEQK